MKSSAMATSLQPVMIPSRQLEAFLKQHLDRTLGEWQQLQKATAPPTQQGDILRTSTELSRLAMQSMSSPQWAQAIATEVGNFYMKGVTDAMRMLQEQESDTFTKGSQMCNKECCRDSAWPQCGMRCQ
mmetsp:Transcript_33002/g.69253  ORF Transcript_33002/g.69253 Transcript_33002/m.69253 type:complete len:128 (-) Transcript_33002:1154-1537(-)